jgi:hypothetical protein
MPFGPEGVEPSSGPYKEPALAVELRAKLGIGPEGFEPTPCRLKGGYAAITPRPHRSSRAYGFQWITANHDVFPHKVRCTTSIAPDPPAPLVRGGTEQTQDSQGGPRNAPAAGADLAHSSLDAPDLREVREAWPTCRRWNGLRYWGSLGKAETLERRRVRVFDW